MMTAIDMIFSFTGAKLVQVFTHNAGAIDMTTALDRAIPFRPGVGAAVFGAVFVLDLAVFTAGP